MTNIIAILLLYKCHLPVVAIENIENTVLSGVAKTRTHSQSLHCRYNSVLHLWVAFSCAAKKSSVEPVDNVMGCVNFRELEYVPCTATSPHL